MTELLPCSHCGGEAELLTFWDFYKFSCKNADCTAHVADAPYVQHAEGTWYGSIDEACAAWNTRAERTCHDVKPSLPFFKCDSCGMEDMGGTELWIQDGFYRSQKPNYCPNCGARVKR